MKRGILTVLLILAAVFDTRGQNSGPIDLILLLDTSSSMSSSYDEVNGYIMGGFLREYLRIGDTFHLIPFSGRPKVDISRRIEGSGDVETIIGRMLLQYPLETWSDISAALSFAESYAATLPSRQKKIVLVSDGVAAPGPGRSALETAELNSLISDTKARLNPSGCSLDFVKVNPGQPLANLPQSGRAPMPGSSSSSGASSSAQGPGTQTQSVMQTPTGQPQAETPRPGQNTQIQVPSGPTAQPGSLTQAGPTAQAGSAAQTGPVAQPGSTTQASSPAQTGSTAQAGSTAQTGPAAQPGSTTQAGSPTQTGSPAQTGPAAQPSSTAQTGPTAQATGSTGQPIVSKPPAVQMPEQNRPSDAVHPAAGTEAESRTVIGFALSMPLIIGIIAAALVLALIIFLVARRPERSAPRKAPLPLLGEEKTPRFADHSRDLANYAASQAKRRTTPYTGVQQTKTQPSFVSLNLNDPLILNLFVEDQNTAIGKRNIHNLKSGYNLTVGGGRSDFLIFLVSIPQAIGEIHRDGSRLTFTPHKPKYFPDLGSKELTDCLDKPIRIVSDKNYELRIKFEQYEDPLEKLNRLLNSLKVPG